MEELVKSIQTQPWYETVAYIVAIFSAVSAVTPTPKEGSVLRRVYTVIDFLAINFGFAKDKGASK
jgi:hypothetical protein